MKPNFATHLQTQPLQFFEHLSPSICSMRKIDDPNVIEVLKNVQTEMTLAYSLCG